MRLYTFKYYSPVSNTWLTHYSPSKEAVLTARGEYVKYAEEDGWVRGWSILEINPSEENLCELLNMATEEHNQ